jgi:hypothetical protein
VLCHFLFFLGGNIAEVIFSWGFCFQIMVSNLEINQSNFAKKISSLLDNIKQTSREEYLAHSFSLYTHSIYTANHRNLQQQKKEGKKHSIQLPLSKCACKN